MGPANLLVELTMRHHGIALNDKSFMNMPKAKREAILAQLLAMSSKLYTEGAGIESLGSKAIQKGEGTLDAIMDALTGGYNLATGGIESTNAPPNLGKKPRSRSSEPYQSGPNMNYR